MKVRKWICFLLLISVAACLAACGNQDGAVFVQSVKSLDQMGGIAPGELFAGMVVSENVTEIQKDQDKSVENLAVREGDDVQEGQELFSYNTEELSLTLEKQQLQQQQLEASIENYQAQIFELEKDRLRASERNKLQYTIQIQTTQIDLKEAELNLKAKKNEVAKSQNLLENATVVSPVTGRIQAINETGTDNNDRELPYITIQQAGSYRVKGMLNELQRGGIMEGDRIRMMARTDSTSVWYGTVTLVDYENPTQGNSNNMNGMATDGMANSSRYPFYIEIDNMDGLILGQHLYMTLDAGEDEVPGLQIGSAFVCFDEDGSSYVWADNGHNKLEKRTVSLGTYNEMRDTYAILDGLEESDFVAFPDAEVCHAGTPTTRVMPQTEGGV